MTFSTLIPKGKSNIHTETTNRMQAGRSAFFVFVQERSVFPLLGGKGLGLPAFCCKAALSGLAGQEKIILASLRYFFLPSLAPVIGKEQPGQ